jgi:hypothetical protein
MRCEALERESPQAYPPSLIQLRGTIRSLGEEWQYVENLSRDVFFVV